MSLLTNKVLFDLFGNSYYYSYCIEFILNCKFKLNKENVINTLIIAKKKIPMTDKELQEYCSNNLNSVINFNIKNEKESTLFLHHIIYSSSDLYKKIISYSKENNIILNINEQNNEGFYPLLYFCAIDEYFELLINYARDNKIVLEMNSQDKNGNNSYFHIIKNGFKNKLKFTLIYKITKLLFDYAKETNYILDLNKKDNEGNSLLLYVILNTDCIYRDFKIKLVQLIIDHASEFNIILEFCEKNNEGKSVISEAYNNYEIFKLLIEYAEKSNVVSDIFKYANIL